MTVGSLGFFPAMDVVRQALPMVLSLLKMALVICIPLVLLFGTYELKYFFGSGLGTETGINASSTAVRALIKQLVAAEDPKKPLSDSQIADLLKVQGIECARRTVAKYREALRIAPTHLRKAL